MKFDLHMHSDASPDGDVSVKDLVQIAKEKGLKVMALTDHDRVCNVPAITEEAAREGIRVIPGIECSTLYGKDNVHVLGYGIDLNDPYFVSLADQVKGLSIHAFLGRYEVLKKTYGFETTLEEVDEKAQGKSPWFALFELITQEPKIRCHPDFQPYLPGGARSEPAAVNFYWDKMQAGSPFYVPTGYPDIFETIDKIHQAGGLAFVAHPSSTFYKKKERLQALKDAGLDGLEAYSNYHDDERNAYYANMAKELGLLISCGSDFHGSRKPKIEMNAYGLPKSEASDEILHNFLEALDNRPVITYKAEKKGRSKES